MPHAPQRAYYTITRIPLGAVVTRRASVDGRSVVVERRIFLGRRGLDRAVLHIYGRP